MWQFINNSRVWLVYLYQSEICVLLRKMWYGSHSCHLQPHKWGKKLTVTSVIGLCPSSFPAVTWTPNHFMCEYNRVILVSVRMVKFFTLHYWTVTKLLPQTEENVTEETVHSMELLCIVAWNIFYYCICILNILCVSLILNQFNCFINSLNKKLKSRKMSVLILFVTENNAASLCWGGNVWQSFVSLSIFKNWFMILYISFPMITVDGLNNKLVVFLLYY